MNRKNEFRKLLCAYGDACFDCGEWQKDDTDVPYIDLMDKLTEARTAVENYVEALHEQIKVPPIPASAFRSPLTRYETKALNSALARRERKGGGK